MSTARRAPLPCRNVLVGMYARTAHTRLMGDKGFPALMRSAKRFKPRGKGHEVGVAPSCDLT